jgi:hypothetical protein
VYSLRSRTDVNGSRIVVSSNSGPIDFGGDCPVVAGALSVAKFGPDAKCDWDLGWDAPPGPGNVSLAVEPSTGDFVIGSTANQAIDFGNGVVTSPSGRGYDALVTKFGWTGRAEWTHRIANVNDVEPYNAAPYVTSLAILSNGDVVAAGLFYADTEVELGAGVVRRARPATMEVDRSAFLIVLDGESGELRHDRIVDRAAFTANLPLAAGPGSVIAFAGGVASATGGGVDFGGGDVPPPEGANPAGYGAFLALYDSELNPCTVERWGDGQDQLITDVVFRPGGGVAICGMNPGSITFDELYVSSATDGFVVALKPASVP